MGGVLRGEGDWSQDRGLPRQYDHPTVASAIDEILGICKEHKVICGHPHVDSKNVETLLARTLSPRLSYVCNFCLLLMGVAIVVAIVIAVALTKFGLLSEYIEYILYYTLLYLVIL